MKKIKVFTSFTLSLVMSVGLFSSSILATELELVPQSNDYLSSQESEVFDNGSELVTETNYKRKFVKTIF